MRTAFEELIAGDEPSRCVVVAEIGVNHNGRAERAFQLVDEAKRCGADAAKLQFFTPAELCSGRHRSDELRMLEALWLSDEDHARIVAHARKIGLPIFATPFDERSLALVMQLGLPLVKLGSGEVTHTPFLQAAARTGLPIILSTGGCDLSDVDRAERTLRNAGATRITLLHCVSAYPPPDADANLRAIATLAERYPHCLIGYSDHTRGADAAAPAVALGACVIEKHLTLDRNDAGPDHAASADPAIFAEMVRDIRRTDVLCGDGVKRRMACEPVIGRSIVAARFLPEGHEIRSEDLAFRRPGRGVRPYEAEKLVGHKLVRAVNADELIEVQDVR